MSTNQSQSWSEWSNQNHKAIEAAEAASVAASIEQRATEARCAESSGSAVSYVPLPEVMEIFADPVRLRANILRHGPPGYDLIDRNNFDMVPKQPNK